MEYIHLTGSREEPVIWVNFLVRSGGELDLVYQNCPSDGKVDTLREPRRYKPGPTGGSADRRATQGMSLEILRGYQVQWRMDGIAWLQLEASVIVAS